MYGTSERDESGLTTSYTADYFTLSGDAGYPDWGTYWTCVVTAWTFDESGAATGTPYGCAGNFESYTTAYGGEDDDTLERCAKWCFRETDCVAFSVREKDWGHKCWYAAPFQPPDLAPAPAPT